jgi:RNA polymerase sigma factor (TIGR02999 family)
METDTHLTDPVGARGDDDRDSLDRLVVVLYTELRQIAHRHLSRRRDGATLNTTALVHEAYLKLEVQSRAEGHDRVHFLALAAVAMRHILIDHARAHASRKRGGAWHRVSLDEIVIAPDQQPDALLQIHDALEHLALIDARLARVVELRFFGGLSNEEIAESLGVAERTVERDWIKARMLLREVLVS